jgi:hypothetical protein
LGPSPGVYIHMRLPAKSTKRVVRSSPKVAILLRKSVRLASKLEERLAFDLAQEWSEDNRIVT